MRSRSLWTLCLAIALRSMPADAQAVPADAQAVPADAQAVPADAQPVPTDAQLWADLKQQPAEKIATDQTAFWVRTLGLNDQQATALRAINRRYADHMRLTARSTGEDEQKLDTMEMLAEDHGEEMMAILTSEQRERYRKFLDHQARFVRKQAE
jgi:hypothetical protein